MRKILFVLLVLSYCLPVMAQVNIQTGSATFSLPVFAWKDDRSRLMNAVALQYNSAYGLRVDEVATSIGTGWGLMGGGVISRIQAGEPDDQKPREGAYNDVRKYPAGYLYNTVSASQGCPKALSRYPIFDHPNQVYKQHNTLTADREQDYFTFQVNGQSGTFVLGKNNGDKGVTLGDSKMKIWFDRNETLAESENTRTTIVTFYVQDENGLIYTFNKRGKTRLQQVYGKSLYNGMVIENYGEMWSYHNPYITTSWNLTQVRDPLTRREINFNYEYRNIDNPDGIDIRCEFSAEPNRGVEYITKKRSVAIMPVLSSIQYPDGHSVTFNYDMTRGRYDLQGDYRMKSIDVTYNGRILSSCRLNTSYFILNRIGMPLNANDMKYARLCLKSVTKLGVDLKEDEPPYVFDYYTGSGTPGDFVPPPFYHFQDIWGYYNAGKNNDLLIQQATKGTIPFFISDISDLSPEKVRALAFIVDDGLKTVTPTVNIKTVAPGFAKNGLLRLITSPLGGVTTYEYEQNRIETQTLEDNQFLEYGAGVHVSKVLKSNGGASFDGTSTITTSYVYKKADGTTSFWGGNKLPYNRIMSARFYEPAGKHFDWSDLSCEYEYMYPGVLTRTAAHYIPNENASFMTFYLTSTFFSVAMDVICLIGGNPIPLIIDAIFIAVNIVKSCSANYDKYGRDFMVLNRDAFARNNLPYQFSRVEVIQGDASGNLGRTEYEFTSLADYPLWVNYYSNPMNEWTDPFDPFSLKQQGALWAYGLPKKVTVRDAGNRKVKETEYLYNWNDPNIKRPAVSDMSCHCQIDYSESMAGDWMDMANSQNVNYTTTSITYNIFRPYPTVVTAYQLKVDMYQVYTGRVEVTDTHGRNYKQGDESRYVETRTHFDYNPNNYEVKKIATTQSNGDKHIKEIYYSSDYTTGGALANLVSNNILKVPIAIYTGVENNNDGIIRYIGADVNEFTTLPNSDVKVLRAKTNRAKVPVTGFVFDAGSPYNFPGLTDIGEFKYDNITGALIGKTDEGGRSVTYLYDYNNKFQVATIANAVPSVDIVAYTSFETPQLGGWALNGNAGYTNGGVTGDRAFALSGNPLSVTVKQNEVYKLSFWATGTVTISSAATTLVTSGPMVNGFTYYEYDITAAGSLVSVSGSVNIDELRLYPKKARMSTATYDPLIGKTAGSDENNRLTYYEYDNLGRLRFVKDEKKDVLKMYEYNFKK